MSVIPMRKMRAVLPVIDPVRPAAKPATTIRRRGYLVQYRDGMDCPGCGHGAFHIGRQSAECGKCGTALPFAPARGDRS